MVSVSSRTQKKRNNLSGHSRKRRMVSAIQPSLKHSFDVLEHEVAKIIKAGHDPKKRVREFQAVWRKIFGRPVEAIAAEAYLQVKMKPNSLGRTRRQKGGGAIAGAPLDFQTRPGVDGTHGTFLPYVTQGLGFYNSINQQSLFKGCGTENITPAVPADLGSNKVGGGMLSDAWTAISTRPATANSPPSILNDIQTAMQGRSLGASPAPDQNQLRLM